MNIGYFSVALQAFLKTLENVWFLSRRSKIKSLFKDYFAPIYKENRKILDDLFDYIICSTGKLDIEFVIEIAIKYISPRVGGKIMTIAEKLKRRARLRALPREWRRARLRVLLRARLRWLWVC